MAEGVCRVGVLGPLVLEREGRPVPLPSGRQRSLLALLLMAGGAPLSRQAAGYALRRGEFELDSVRFDALVERARAEPDQARTLLREALDLVRGEPLCDVPAERSLAQWRRALEEKCLHALVLRIEADLEAGAAGELVAELESLVAAHPFEERPWAQLMLALCLSPYAERVIT
ncbi:MAG TPA: BTAD domain-containing putative transcriptional regulator [Solirubrobacteraceae bacterium]